jgi:hypothetical protein
MVERPYASAEGEPCVTQILPFGADEKLSEQPRPVPQVAETVGDAAEEVDVLVSDTLVSDTLVSDTLVSEEEEVATEEVRLVEVALVAEAEEVDDKLRVDVHPDEQEAQLMSLQ